MSEPIEVNPYAVNVNDYVKQGAFEAAIEYPVIVANITGGADVYKMGQPIHFPFVLRSLRMQVCNDTPAILCDGVLDAVYTWDLHENATAFQAGRKLWPDLSTQDRLRCFQVVEIPRMLMYFPEVGGCFMIRATSLGGGQNICGLLVATITPIPQILRPGYVLSGFAEPQVG